MATELWPMARHYNFAAGAPVPAATQNEIEDRIRTLMGGGFDGARFADIVIENFNYYTWAKGSPPPRWGEVASVGGGGGLQGISIINRGPTVRLETDTAVADNCQLVAGLFFNTQVSLDHLIGSRQCVRTRIGAGATTSRIDWMGFYDYGGAATYEIGLRADTTYDSGNWNIVVNDNVNQKRQSLSVTPSSGTPAQVLSLQIVSATEIVAQVDAGAPVTMTVGGGGEPVQFDNVAWPASMEWMLEVVTQAAAARYVDVEYILAATGQSVL